MPDLGSNLPHPRGPGGGPGTLEPAPGGERDWLRFRDDAVPDEPAVSLDGFLDQSNAVSVRIEAGDDVRLLGPVLDRIIHVLVRSAMES